MSEPSSDFRRELEARGVSRREFMGFCSAMAVMFGLPKGATVAEMIARAGTVPGIDAADLNYPDHVGDATPRDRAAQLAEVIARCLPRQKPGQSHPATRSFQAIRIAVNDEFGELVAGLEAAERALRPGGILAVDDDEVGHDPGLEHRPDHAHELAPVADAELEAHRLAVRQLAQPPTHLVPVGIRHHNIQDNQVWQQGSDDL